MEIETERAGNLAVVRSRVRVHDAAYSTLRYRLSGIIGKDAPSAELDRSLPSCISSADPGVALASAGECRQGNGHLSLFAMQHRCRKVLKATRIPDHARHLRHSRGRHL